MTIGKESKTFYLQIILHLPTLQNLAPDVRGNGM